MPGSPSWIDGSTLEPSSRTSETRRVEARLVVVSPPELVQTIALAEPRVVLGRSTGVGHELPHRTVARQHFCMTWDPGLARHVGADLGSKNGSWIDGVRIGPERHTLHDSAVVRVGDVMMVFEVDDGAAPAGDDVIARDA